MTVSPHLDKLPDDVLGPILSRLSIRDLLSLRITSKSLHRRIDDLGLPIYHSQNKIPHTTLHPSVSTWNMFNIVEYNHHIDTSLSRHRWHANQIGRTWTRAVIPILHLTDDRLLLGVGGKIVSHALVPSMNSGDTGGEGQGGRMVSRAREYPLIRPGSETGTRSDIVGIINLHDGPNSLVVAQFDGTIQRLTLPESGASIPRVTARYTRPSSASMIPGGGGIGGNGSVHTFTGNEDGSLILSTLASGQAVLHHTKSPWQEPSAINLSPQAPRAWSSLLSSTHRCAMLGVSGSIDVHHLRPAGLDSVPAIRLHGPDLPQTSSPYDMKYAPDHSSHHPSLLLSAWYDSHLRLHDLREKPSSPIALFSSSTQSDASAPKVMSAGPTFFDPYTWADGSAFYSCAFVGSHHIAGGCARHGTVAIFDLRQPSTSRGGRGWSCFSPGGKGSPVYSLQGDGGRLWGVTEKRAFVLSFDGQGGLVHPEARPYNGTGERDRRGGGGGGVREVPSGYKGRGGKWGWTVRYDQNEGTSAVGYEHRDRGVELFDSLPVDP